jgi:hypothetical protein
MRLGLCSGLKVNGFNIRPYVDRQLLKFDSVSTANIAEFVNAFLAARPKPFSVAVKAWPQTFVPNLSRISDLRCTHFGSFPRFRLTKPEVYFISKEG